MLDWGTWEPGGSDESAPSIAKGELHFDLEGEKLAGRFVLVRRDRDRSGKEQWLLLHKNDDHAVPRLDPEDHPRSVKSGGMNDEVAAAPEALWQSGVPAGEATVPLGQGHGPSWDPATEEELADSTGWRRGSVGRPGARGHADQLGQGALPRSRRRAGGH